MTQSTTRRKWRTTTVTVDVEIDEDALLDNGWHHEDDCPKPPDSKLGPAVASLHRQAHPGQAISVRLCREEPCRSLTLEQLDEVDR